MRTRRGIWLAVLLVAVIGGWGWVLLRPPAAEPMYEGKPLGYWLEQAGSWPQSQHSAGKPPEAVTHIGTNALPTLLRMLRARDSGLALKLVALAQRQHRVKIHFIPATERNFEAMQGFRILGPKSSNAVPELIKILDADRSPTSATFTIYSLAYIGPAAAPAVPVLLRSATNAAPEVRYNSLWALGQIKADPALAVPALVRGLSDANPNVRAAAVEALGSFGAAARPAIPALLIEAGDTQLKMRETVKEAVRKIDPEAADKIKN